VAGPVVIDDAPGPERATGFAWAVFALSFGLLMSDHMARQVLNAVGPLLKAEWQLADAELASLSSVVALAVGLLTFPLSLAADRYGRVKSLFAMAALWSAATLGASFAQSYQQMLLARLMVGVGEAAYGSVGIAVVLAVFPVTMRSTLSSAFLAGSVIGQVLGVAIGAEVAAAHGWRAAFQVIGLGGLVLAVLYPMVVREARLGAGRLHEKLDWGLLGRQLLGRRVLWLTYFASGIQLFCTGTLAVFLPLLLTRHYAMPIAQAGKVTALFLLVCAAGMVLCGMLSDRLARRRPEIKPQVAMGLSVFTALAFAGAFAAPPGAVQLVLLACGLLTVAGVAGIAGAMVANLTPSSVHGTAMALLALANNLFGLAPGPMITGWLSDRSDLLTALKLLPLPCLLALGAMALARRDYATEVGMLKK
jgi:MFS family permease